MPPSRDDSSDPHDRAAFMPPGPGDAAASARRSRLGPLRFALYLLAGGVVGALGAVFGRSLAASQPDWPWPPVSVPLALLAALLTLWPNIVLHEAGHAAAGIARGLRPVAFGIGPLRWERGRSRWRFRRGMRIGGIAGFASLLPEGERGLSRLDQMVYLAGGPFANLATAALAFALLPLADSSPRLAGLLLGTGASAAFLGLLNLVPFHSQGWRSDGRGLLDLLRRTPEGALQQRIHHLLALNMAGVRPRDWPSTLLPDPVDAPSSPMLAANGDLLRLSWAMDRDDGETAAAAARRVTAAFATLPEAVRPHVAVALAGHAARNLRDPTLLAAWRPLCDGGVTDLSLMRAWLDAEHATLSGRAGDARTAIAGARDLLDRAPDPVTARLLGEYLDDLDRRLDDGVAAQDAAVKGA